MRPVPVEERDWGGLLDGRRTNQVEFVIKGLLGPSEGGSSGSFPGLGSDGLRWYVKPQNNKQGGRVIITEYVVSAVGLLIGAPVCEVRPANIPPELAGHQVEGSVVLEEGVASASRAVPDAEEIHGLTHRDRDENRRRQAGVYALFDWCWGDDGQWLYVRTDDSMIFSHDHGFYLPPGGADWTKVDLLSTVDQPHPIGDPPDGLDAAELDRLADALDGITRSSLAEVLASVPSQWPVPDSDLEALGYFLERRAPGVASRMRTLSGKL
jgi:hypothetical protein